MSLRWSATINDLMADALIQRVMRADRVEPEALRRLLTVATDRIADLAGSWLAPRARLCAGARLLAAAC
jgi:hypothetical protein